MEERIDNNNKEEKILESKIECVSILLKISKTLFPFYGTLLDTYILDHCKSEGH